MRYQSTDQTLDFFVWKCNRLSWFSQILLPNFFQQLDSESWQVKSGDFVFPVLFFGVGGGLKTNSFSPKKMEVWKKYKLFFMISSHKNKTIYPYWKKLLIMETWMDGLFNRSAGKKKNRNFLEFLVILRHPPIH